MAILDTLASIGLSGAATQGIIWGIMAIGVYITYKILDIADLTVDGSFTTGGAVLVVCVSQLEMNIWLALLLAFTAGCLAGLMTGLFHTKFGIPAILSGILTQFALYSINLRIMTRANVALNVRKFDVLLSSFNACTFGINALCGSFNSGTVLVFRNGAWTFLKSYGL